MSTRMARIEVLIQLASPRTMQFKIKPLSVDLTIALLGPPRPLMNQVYVLIASHIHRVGRSKMTAEMEYFTEK